MAGAIVMVPSPDFDYPRRLREEVAEGPDLEPELNWELREDCELTLILFIDTKLANSA